MQYFVCVGSASQDVIFPMKRLAVLNTPEDLTAQKKIMLELGAKYPVEDRFVAPGGCAANVSQGIARLGGNASCMSVLGKDSLGEEVREELDSEGVETGLLQIRKEYKTDLSFVLVDCKGGDRTILYNRDANEHLEIDEIFFREALGVFVGGLYGAWQKNLDRIVAGCARFGVPLFFNPGQGNIAQDIEQVTVGIRASLGVFLNKDEAIEVAMFAEPSWDREKFNDERFLLRLIKSLGPAFVSLTDGVRGAWVYDGADILHASVDPVSHVVDSTGAGDAYTAAFLAAFSTHKGMSECIQWGIANGRSVVQHYGAKEGLLHVNAIKKLAQRVIVKDLL